MTEQAKAQACPWCKQDVPVRADGIIVSHKNNAKGGPHRKEKPNGGYCTGSGRNML